MPIYAALNCGFHSAALRQSPSFASLNSHLKTPSALFAVSPVIHKERACHARSHERAPHP